MSRAPIGSAGAGGAREDEDEHSASAAGVATVVDDRCPECGHEARCRSEWRADSGYGPFDAWRCPSCSVPVAVDGREDRR